MKWVVTVVVVGALAALFFTGSLDKMLYPLGLNHGECDRDASGEVLCGAELADYEKQQEDAKDAANKAANEAQDRANKAIGNARDAAKDAEADRDEARAGIGAAVDEQQGQNQQALDSLDKAAESYEQDVDQEGEAYDDFEAGVDKAEKNAAEAEKNIKKNK